MKILIITILLLLASLITLRSEEWKELELGFEIDSETLFHFADSSKGFIIKPYSGECATTENGGDMFKLIYDDSPSSIFQNQVEHNKDTIYSVIFSLLDDSYFIRKSWGHFSKSKDIIQIEGSGVIPASIYYVRNDKEAYHTKPFDKGGPNKGWEMYKTENGGEKWEKRQSFAQDNLIDMYFNGDDVYVIMSSGSIYRSDPVSIDWEVIPTHAVYPKTFVMTGKQEGFTASKASLVYTNDNWQTVDTLKTFDEANGYIIAVSTVGTDKIWVAQSQALYRSSDKGTTWERVELEITGSIPLITDLQIIDLNKAVVTYRDILDDSYHIVKNFEGTSSGIADVEDGHFTISRGEGQIIVRNQATDAFGVMVSDINGRLLLSEEVNSGNFTIQSTDLPNAVLIKIAAEGKSYTYKLIL